MPTLLLSLASRLRALLVAPLLLALGFTSAAAQEGAAGYSYFLGNTAPTTDGLFASPIASDTVFVIPFSLFSPGSGTYTLHSLQLGLRAPDAPGEGPANGPENGSGSDGDGRGGGRPGDPGPLTYMSLKVFSELPTTLSLPTPLLSFATGSPEAVLTNVPIAYDFLPGSSFSFTAGVIYYLTVSYIDTPGMFATWSKTTNDTYDYDYPGDLPVTSPVASGAPLVFYKIASDGVQGFYDNAGGFLIRANALTPIPEPATSTALAAGAVLAALWLRRRRPLD